MRREHPLVGAAEPVLPDFCSRSAAFAVVVLVQLLAFVLALAAHPDDFWMGLAWTSLFLHWIGLPAAGLLCLLHRPLAGLAPREAALAAFAILLAVVLAASETAYRFEIMAGLGADGHAGFLLRNLAIGAILGGLVLRYLYIQWQWKRRLRAEAEARLQALQATIRPHFLFNSMNTIAAMVREQPERAEETVEDLADLFRANLAEGRRLVPLADEVALARRYLRIEALRLGGRLHVVWDLDAVPATTLLPPLTLQPLLENAVYHGIEPSPAGGELRVTGACDGSRATVTIDNPVPEDPRAGNRAGNQLALDNIRERLAAHFPGVGALRAEQSVGGRYRVHLVVPCPPEGAGA